MEEFNDEYKKEVSLIFRLIDDHEKKEPEEKWTENYSKWLIINLYLIELITKNPEYYRRYIM